MLQSLRDAISLQDDDDFEDILEEQPQKDADTQYVLHMSDSDSCSDLTDDEDEYRQIHAVTTILPQEWIIQEEMGHLGSIGLKQIDNTPRPHFNIKVKASKGLDSIQHTAHPDDPPVHYYENGKPIYVSHIQGHFIWDVDPSMCDSDCDCQDWNEWGDSEDKDYARRRRKSKKKKKQSCTVSRRPDPPDEPDYKPTFSLKRRSQKSCQDHA
ncbi:hypothetical protein PIB30_059885 [Stylosanthes scabra]|uniref:Uncharacterized protein n=1 Tax=Stylosanthes scabra TaxID=79078 RepID=A0ABU6VIV3_9FABA|nr:hypothetical protein [Stylosanthes scabra]